MKTWDAIVIGAGIIGLSVALELRRRGLRVLVVEKGEPVREASWAAGGMLVDFALETPQALRELATASAEMYPEFVAGLESDTGLRIDLRSAGTLFFAREGEASPSDSAMLPEPLSSLEPELQAPPHAPYPLFVRERSVDPRQLTQAALAAAERNGIEFACGAAVLGVATDHGRAAGVRTATSSLTAGTVVNCAGAWAGQIAMTNGACGGGLAASIPTRPVKGQMLSVAMPRREFLRHVVRTPDIYLIPRSDGRLVIGATSEEAGFDKQLVPETLERQRQNAIRVLPGLAEAPVLETWCGLRPGTPDKLPILGATSTPGYFLATGHYRDGILLAPVTARVIAELAGGKVASYSIEAFSPARFHGWSVTS